MKLPPNEDFREYVTGNFGCLKDRLLLASHKIAPREWLDEDVDLFIDELSNELEKILLNIVDTY